MENPWMLLGLFAGVGVFIVIFLYNGLIGKKNAVHNTLSSVDVYLTQRYDLIPNLVAAVKAFMKHERSVLEEITKMRTQALAGNLSDRKKVDLNNRISKALGSIMVAVENYPELKSS